MEVLVADRVAAVDASEAFRGPALPDVRRSDAFCDAFFLIRRIFRSMLLESSESDSLLWAVPIRLFSGAADSSLTFGGSFFAKGFGCEFVVVEQVLGFWGESDEACVGASLGGCSGSYSWPEMCLVEAFDVLVASFVSPLSSVAVPTDAFLAGEVSLAVSLLIQELKVVGGGTSPFSVLNS